MTLSDRTLEVLAAVREAGSARAAEKATGTPRSTIRHHLRLAAKAGLSPALAPKENPAGMSLVKTTVQFDAAGNVRQEWRRLSPDLEAAEQVVKSMEARVDGKAQSCPAPGQGQAGSLLEVIITDHHFGMLAWGKETGEDYDCALAAQVLVAGVRSLIQGCPGRPAKIVIANLGDYFHSDNRQGTTERSGHILDVDSRFDKRIDAAINAFLDVVDLALAAADQVEVITVGGNHDWHSCKWLPRLLAAYYRKEPRLSVRVSPKERQYVEWGKVLLGYTHGENVKPQLLASNMPVEEPQAWARTQWRRWRTGHVHHQITKEFPGVVVETLSTLAAPDAYAHGMGLHAVRAIVGFLWDAEWGLRARLERSAAELVRPS